MLLLLSSWEHITYILIYACIVFLVHYFLYVWHFITKSKELLDELKKNYLRFFNEYIFLKMCLIYWSLEELFLPYKAPKITLGFLLFVCFFHLWKMKKFHLIQFWKGFIPSKWHDFLPQVQFRWKEKWKSVETAN